MTNTVAVWLAAVLLIAIAGDMIVYDGENLIFLGKKFLDLVEWMAFWR